MTVQAFISCRFPVDESVKSICEMLRPEITPYISTEVKLGNLPYRLKERIANSDCLIAILTETGDSAFIQNELGIAFACNKPIFAIYEQSVDVGGIQPYLSTFIHYDKDRLAAVATELASLKTVVAAEVSAREIAGAPEEVLQALRDNGVQGLYPDRASAFRVFTRIWNRESTIRIVGSSIEGFKRGIGIDARDLLLGKLESEPASTIHVLLTHASFARFREPAEREPDGYIVGQTRATTLMLNQIRTRIQQPERLQWKFFKGAPTCFMIMAGDFMLLNPYLYMQPAYFNFSMIVKRTGSPFDIFHHYREYHFQRAWDHPELATRESGLDD